MSEDADLRWAHHGYLQASAETGAAGLVLVLALLGWAWVRLWLASRSAGARAALGSAVVLVVALHGTVDYVWHLPPVMSLAALLFGGATAEPGSPPADRPRASGYLGRSLR